jgi:lipoprotein-releasing system permease protein
MSSLSFSSKIALRYLWSRRAEAFITIITLTSIVGVAIGVMVLNIVMAVMTGFQGELREKILGTNSHIVVRRAGGNISDWQAMKGGLEKVPGVKSVSPFTYHQVLVRNADKTTGLLVRGIEAGSAAAAQLQQYLRTPVSRLFDPPALEREQGNEASEAVKLPGIVIGRQLAFSLQLLPGTPISLLSPSVSSSPFGLMPRYRRFVVAGIYSSGLTEYESGLAYVSLKEAQEFFRMGDEISGFELRVDNPEEAPAVASAITGRFDGITASDWTSANQSLWDALKLEKRVYFIVLLLIIVMASFSIITTLVMMVLEKRRDIAIVKTMGATAGVVARIFIIQGSVIGALGTALGLLLGYAGCVGLRIYGFPLDERVFQMSTLPVKIDPLNFAMVGAAAFIICCLATIYPARRASRLDPSEILRYE